MERFALTNCDIWPGDGGRLSGHVVVRDGRVESVGEGPYGGELPAEDLGGQCLSPGLVDLMVCGGFGCTLHDDDPRQLLAPYVRLGVTSCQACTACLASGTSIPRTPGPPSRNAKARHRISPYSAISPVSQGNSG